MNRLQRHLRVLSDDRLDDTSVEMDACERAQVALDLTKRALMDGCITSTEALEILEAQRAVLEANTLSLAYNIRQQHALDEFIAYLSNVPANIVARMPALPVATGGDVIRRSDDLEAA